MPATAANKWRGRIFRYAPLFIWIGVIFFLSSNLGAASNTSRIIRPLLIWLFPDITEPSLQLAHFWVRKTAHFTAYGILGFWAARAFKASSFALLRDRRFLFSFLVVFIVAVCDEINQSFLNSRTGSPYDILLDTAGGAALLAGIWLFSKK